MEAVAAVPDIGSLIASLVSAAGAEKAFAVAFAFVLLRMLHDDLGVMKTLLGQLVEKQISNEASALVRHADLQSDVRALTRATQAPRRTNTPSVAGGAD